MLHPGAAWIGPAGRPHRASFGTAMRERSPMKDRPLIDVAPHRPTLCAPPATTIRTACARMREEQVSAIVVTDAGGRLLGIFTGRDAICRVLAEGRDPDATTLAEVMTSPVATLGPRDRAIDALHLMHDGGFRHVPVVEEGRVRRLVLRSDFRALERAQIEAEAEIFEVLR
jgi:CBS domain-containing protein